jgi:hypothetical protein
MKDMKKERLRTSESFLAIVHHCSMAKLDDIVTMGEPDSLFHTPKIKEQSKQWQQKGQPGPVKGQGPGDQDQADGLSLLRPQRPDLHQPMPRGTTENDIYVVDALGWFIKIQRRRSWQWWPGDW